MTEQLVAEIATRLCGPHSRERLSRSKGLINKFNSTGTFRRHFGQVSKEKKKKKKKKKLLKKQGFLCSFWSFCETSLSLIEKKLTKDLVLTFDTASPSMDSLGAINLILDLARGRI